MTPSEPGPDDPARPERGGDRGDGAGLGGSEGDDADRDDADRDDADRDDADRDDADRDDADLDLDGSEGRGDGPTDRMAVINDVVRRRAGQVVLGVDLAATFVFAIEGGLAGVDARLDLFGVMVIALMTATGGGMMRDVLMGDTPPRSLRTARYVLVGTGGGVLAFLIHQTLTSVPENLLTGLDAVGLSLFAVSGAALALAAGMHPLTAVLLGTITAVGGGTLRDVLLNRVPVILEANIYALAALLGAAVMVWLVRGGRPRSQAMVVGAACCFVLRVVSVWQNWNLPIAGG